MITWAARGCWLLLATLTSNVAATSEEDVISDRQYFSEKYHSPDLRSLSRIKEAQGIVFVSGGSRQLANTYVAIRVLQDHLECRLPIEIAYHGQDEMDKYHRSLFEVRAIVLSSLALWAA